MIPMGLPCDLGPAESLLLPHQIQWDERLRFLAPHPGLAED